MCGEKVMLELFIRHEVGSPPRMRGKAIAAPPLSAARRITPAYAGKRNLARFFAMISLDHPRMCGEKLSFAQTYCLRWGSPPHVRGKAGKRYVGTRGKGITPACAGKSDEFSFKIVAFRDHPRMCGEKFSISCNK